MLTQWLTVVSWQHGKALLRYEAQSACGQCGVQAGCGSRLLNTLATADNYLITVDYPQPLLAGQKVELAIEERSLLISALLVYLSPVAGLLAMASLFQMLFATDMAALCGAICGGAGGVLLAQAGWKTLNQRYRCQPAIVTIALPVNVIPPHNSR